MLFFSGGCWVDGRHHPEGGKVLGVGHSVCDNCYCLKGLLRCEPLSCAPPLLGCNPVIKPGECCATSYNCSKYTGSTMLSPFHIPPPSALLTSSSSFLHLSPCRLHISLTIFYRTPPWSSLIFSTKVVSNLYISFQIDLLKH